MKKLNFLFLSKVSQKVLMYKSASDVSYVKLDAWNCIHIHNYQNILVVNFAG